jgi:regulator of protease activity HflC (stomatin/prohibitin superfamily)
MNAVPLSAPTGPHHETTAQSAPGVPMLLLDLVLFVTALLLFGAHPAWDPTTGIILGAILVVAGVFVASGFFSLQPNEAAVLSLFGAYRGSVRTSGLRWTNPFYRAAKISLRVRNFSSEKLKVNDKAGNPIEIAAVVVWRVRDTAQASFDIDSYANYVTIQSESALRHIASSYFYDGEDRGSTLLGGGSAVSAALTQELEERLASAGVEVAEARITHLAYAPEIAQAMLRRQQAEAVIAARQKIVANAVGMVEMALDELAKKHVVQLDEERKAAMVSNLLVVLCGETEAQPVINAGTLYS